MHKRINIAITGGIGSGKSHVIEKMKGFKPFSNYFSVDAAVKELYMLPSWREWLMSNFGTTKKEEISSLAFSDATIRKQIMDRADIHLNGVIDNWLASNSPDCTNIVEFPLLFEYDAEKKFDIIVLITAPLNIRVDRVRLRDNKPASEITKIIEAQLSDDIKAARSDIIIDTAVGRPRDYTWKLVQQLEKLITEKRKCLEFQQ